jgi:hypothetical protein
VALSGDKRMQWLSQTRVSFGEDKGGRLHDIGKESLLSAFSPSAEAAASIRRAQAIQAIVAAGASIHVCP